MYIDLSVRETVDEQQMKIIVSYARTNPPGSKLVFKTNKINWWQLSTNRFSQQIDSNEKHHSSIHRVWDLKFDDERKRDCQCHDRLYKQSWAEENVHKVHFWQFLWYLYRSFIQRFIRPLTRNSMWANPFNSMNKSIEVGKENLLLRE